MSRANVKQNIDTRRVVGSFYRWPMNERESMHVAFYCKTQELFTLTYGAFVAQILSDYEHVDEVNKQLDKM
jgi:hypothetical protein